MKEWGHFPGGPAFKNPPSNAGDVGSIPGREVRTHMPRGNEAHLLQRRAPGRSPHAAAKTQHSQKNKQKQYLKKKPTNNERMGTTA